MQRVRSCSVDLLIPRSHSTSLPLDCFVTWAKRLSLPQEDNWWCSYFCLLGDPLQQGITIQYRTPTNMLVKLEESFRTFFQSRFMILQGWILCSRPTKVTYSTLNTCYVSHPWLFAHTALFTWDAFSSLPNSYLYLKTQLRFCIIPEKTASLMNSPNNYT